MKIVLKNERNFKPFSKNMKSAITRLPNIPKRISCDYLGRFGNNLFQIATALSLAEKNGANAIFSPWNYKDIFIKKINTGFSREGMSRYYEPEYSYNEIPYQNDLIINGYFQSEKYFNSSLVRSFFQFEHRYHQYIEQNFGKYIKKNCTSIHVRRGDYIENPEYHNPQPIEYYIDAMSHFPDSDIFLIFSDDMEWCQQNLIDSKIIYIKGQKDYIDMMIMSKCNNNIITNSSFSWWGAWLNENHKHQVIAPKKWFGKLANLDTKDLIPNKWKLI